jgi:hypothetical protein
MIIRYALRPCDLKDAPLRIIPKEDLDVVVRVVRIFGSEVASRFENYKPAVTANTPGKRFRGRIGKLTDDGIDLSPDGEADCKQSYNC